MSAAAGYRPSAVIGDLGQQLAAAAVELATARAQRDHALEQLQQAEDALAAAHGPATAAGTAAAD